MPRDTTKSPTDSSRSSGTSPKASAVMFACKEAWEDPSPSTYTPRSASNSLELNEAKTRRLVDKMRERIPGLILRTTFLVGFPGETEEDFEALRRFVQQAEFERLGVFSYSREEGTPAGAFPEQVPEEVKQRRLEEVMLSQQEIAIRHNHKRRGEEVCLLIDSLSESDVSSESIMACGRSYGESPEIDPRVLIVRPGTGPFAGSQDQETTKSVHRRETYPSETTAPEFTVGEFAKVQIQLRLVNYIYEIAQLTDNKTINEYYGGVQ